MNQRLMSAVASAAVAVLAVGMSNAHAQKHYFSQNDRLYSFDVANPSGTLSFVTMTGLGPNPTDLRVAGLAFDPSGNLWGSNASGRFFTINTTTGATTAKFTTAAATPVASFDFRQNGSTLEILAAQTAPGGVSNLRTFNAATGVQTGSVSLNLAGAPTNNAGDPASGYDASTGKYYIVKGGAASNATQDFSLRSYDVATNTFSTPLATNLTWASAGGAWFGGQLYFGYRPGVDVGLGNWNLPSSGATADDVVFGGLNTATGAFSPFTLFDLSIPGAMTGTGPSFGYAVSAVPEPGTHAMLLAGVAMLSFWARRRGI